MARQMKDSGIEWIGEIPETWNQIRLKYCCSVLNGFPFDSKNFTLTEGFPLIRIRDITSGCTETRYNGPFDSAFVVNNGDLLVGMDGDFNIRLWDGGMALLNQRCCKLIEEQGITRQFLFYYLPFRLKWVNDLTYATTVKHLSSGDIVETALFVPSIAEQQRIAAFLDRKCAEIDAIIERTKATIEEYKKLKQAVITEAVTKGVRGPRPMKDSGIEWIGEIPEEWEARKLSGLSERIVVGVVIRPSEYFDEQGTVPFIRGLNVKEYQIVENDFVYITEESNQLLDKSIIHTGDVLIVRDGSIGTSCVVPPKYDGANVVSLVIVTTGEELLSDYLCYLLNSDIGKHQFEMTKIGSALTHTSVGSVSKIKCLLPSVTEQQEIIEYLDTKRAALDTLIAKKTALLTELETYKKSLIYEYVTGKKEV